MGYLAYWDHLGGKRMRIGVDLDDVLVDMVGPLVHYYNPILGYNFSRADNKSFQMRQLWQCTQEESIDRINKYYQAHDPRSLPPIPGAQKAIAHLSKEHELLIITGRPKIIETKTRETLSHHFPNVFDDVHFTNFFNAVEKNKSKAEYCRELQVDVFIEDHYRWAHQIASEDIDTLLFDTPWNQEVISHARMKRVHSWEEITDFIHEKARK